MKLLWCGLLLFTGTHVYCGWSNTKFPIVGDNPKGVIFNSNSGKISSVQAAAPSGRNSMAASSRALLALSFFTQKKAKTPARIQYGTSWPVEETQPKDLKFNTGDIISCRSGEGQSHIFLASNTYRVIHALRPEAGNLNIYTRIREESFTRASKNYEVCSVITDWYDGQMNSKCNQRQPNSIDEVKKSARNSVLTYLRDKSSYDDVKCNSEHFVTAWKYGIALSLQSGAGIAYKSDNCNAPGMNTCSS